MLQHDRCRQFDTAPAPGGGAGGQPPVGNSGPPTRIHHNVMYIHNVHNALRHHLLMPISCHFRDCKALLVTSLTHVSGAIASVQTLPLPLPLYRTARNDGDVVLYTLPAVVFLHVTLAGKPFHGSTRGRRGRRCTVTNGMVARLV